MRLTLAVLAAGLGSRFGGGKALAAVGPDGEALLDFAIYDARRAGLHDAIVVVRRETEGVVRAHVERVVGDGFPVRFVRQDDPPLPPGRRAPWGTGHAVLVAARHGDDACVVVNGDDYYGPTAITAMATQLRAAAAAGDHAVGAYRLDATPMSEDGGVSRAVITADAARAVHGFTEVRDIRPAGDGFVGRDADGRPYALDGSEPVSMNLWGFHRTIVPVLERAFAAFLAADPDPAAEFLIGDAVTEAVARDGHRVRSVPITERGAGLTWAGDLAAARSVVAALIADGRYPASLAEGFRRPPTP